VLKHGKRKLFQTETLPEFEVVVYTKKTLRLRKNNKDNFTFKLAARGTSAEGKGANLLRDIEGILRLDLLQQYNPFHEVSDIFRLTQLAIQGKGL